MSDLLLYDSPGPLAFKGLDADGNLRAEGYLVVFSGEDAPDLTGDYFTAKTDFGVLSDGVSVTLPAYYDHGLDATLGTERIGRLTVKMDEAGVFAEYTIQRRQEYLARLIEGGHLGQSSGAVAHLVERENGPMQKATWLKCWPLGEGSLTPTPAEPRTAAVSVKSLRAHRDGIKALPAPTEGVNALRSRVERAFRSRFLFEDEYGYVEDLFPGYVLVHTHHAVYRVPCDDGADGLVFADRSEWTEVEPRMVWEPIKAINDLFRNESFRPSASVLPASAVDPINHLFSAA